LHKKSITKIIMSAKGSITTSDYLSFEEYRRLVNCLWVDGEYKWSLYCVLSFGLALRISDVLNLVWDDVLEVDSATVEEKKTKKVRRIEIGDSVKKHVKAAYEKLGRPNRRTYIFSTKKSNGFPVSREYVNRVLKTFKEKYSLSIGNFSSHTFRKTFGRYVYESMGRKEEALILLNQVFKHTSIRTTIRYIGIRDNEIGNLFNSIVI
jgi:integrase